MAETVTTTSTTTIERAYRVRLYPNATQAGLLRRLFGARRFVWNWAIRRKAEAWRADAQRIGWVELSREFTAVRCTGEMAWLSELPREPFNQTLRDFDRAWKNFFAGRAKHPKRRRYGTISSARFTIDQRREAAIVDRERGRVTLPRLGALRFRVTEAMLGRLRSITVSRDAGGRWYASFTADAVPAPVAVPAPRQALGVDLGLKDAAVLSTGEVIGAGRHLTEKRRRLRRYQRRMSRQRDAAIRRVGKDPRKPLPKDTRITPSKRMGVTRKRIGRLHAKVADARRNFLHQVSGRIVNSAEIICLEDLAVKGMARSMGRRAFRRSVMAASMGELRRQITYKAAWSGRVVSVVDRHYPSSKTCSGCGEIHQGLTLKDRAWTCAGCGQHHDRDINAAINIEREGLRLLAATAPDGDTRRSREINARGVDACAAGKTPPTGQPTTPNRELTHLTATAVTTRPSRDGPAQRVVG